MAAIYGGHVAILRVLLEHQACASVRDGQGRTALHYAAFIGLSASEIKPMLLDKGVPIDARERHGRTALMVAVRSSRIEPLNVLLSRGANLHLQDISGRSPLRQAVANAES